MSAAAGAAAAAAAAIQNSRAMGVIVKVEPLSFLEILCKAEAPLVVHSQQTVFFTTRFNYITSYKGLAFFATSPTPIQLPPHVETIQAKHIWVPG